MKEWRSRKGAANFRERSVHLSSTSNQFSNDDNSRELLLYIRYVSYDQVQRVITR